MARQDPWDLAPVVPLPTERAPVGSSERGQVVRRPDGSSYVVASREFTNETATQLLNQGYEKQPDGVWAKTVATVPYADAPWNQVEPVNIESNLADRQAVEAGLSALDATTMGLPGQGAYGRALIEQAPFAQDAIQGLAGLTSGTSQADARRIDSYGDDYDRTNNRAQRNLGGVAGFTAGIAAPGGAARGVLQAGALQGAYGTLYGLGTGNEAIQDRGDNALIGGGLGTIGGAALAKGGQVAAPVINRIAGIAGAATRPVREVVGRAIGRRPEAEVVAARRIADQLRRSGATEEEIIAQVGRYREAGLNPSVVDVGGENVFATTRAAAAGEGPGRELAVQYRNTRAAELAPRTIERTRRLTPGEDRDALALAGDLTQARSTQARELYGPAYTEQIVVPYVTIRALRGEEGSQALQYARRLASVEQDFDTMEQIDALLLADLDQSPVASGRALEYVRRAYADLAESAEGQMAAGLQQRLNQIDQGLDEIPALRAARRAYADASGQIDAVGGVPDPRTGRQQLGRPQRAPMSAINERSASRYGAYVEGLPESAALPNQVYQRDQLVNQLAGAREGAVGPLNAITPGANQPLGPNAPTVARNLEATFPGQGQRYQQDIDLARQQMTRANEISPNAGPKTAGVLQDQAAEGMSNLATGANQVRGQTALGMVLGGIGSLARRAGGLNEAERAAIVQLGISDADELVRIVRLADESRAAGRRVPREVRGYITDITGQLGARNPVALELAQRLLPSRVAAEEESQQQ